MDNYVMRPKNGHTLVVVVVCRISTEHQDARSLADQQAYAAEWLARHYDGDVTWQDISSRGSGEYLDRAELLQLEEQIESGQVDLVIAEDLGRICRRTRAYDLCELCQDHDTRLVAINDNVDTARPDWHMTAFFSVVRHEAYNRDTSARIRRTHRNRFAQGGVLMTPIFCYRKPPGAKHDSELVKITDLEPIVEEMVRRLEDQQTYAEVADWLNERKVPLGVGCRTLKWTDKMVKRIVFNPILKGIRQRNRKIAKRINKTGRRKSIDAPPTELLERQCPHLAFIEPARYDRLISRLRAQGELYSVPKRLGHDPRLGRPKKRTRFPGQHVFCGVCGRGFVFGGHGQKDHLMCSGARTHQCWNGAMFDADLAAAKLSTAVFEWMKAIPEFDAMLVSNLEAEAECLLTDRHSARARLERELERIEREIQNHVVAVRAGSYSQSLQADLQLLERERGELQTQLCDLNAQVPPQVQFPPLNVIREQALEEFKDLAVTSPEFAARRLSQEEKKKKKKKRIAWREFPTTTSSSVFRWRYGTAGTRS